MLKRFSSTLATADLAVLAPTCDPVPAAPAPAALVPALSEIERRVIQLARHDPISSVGPVGRRERLARLAFGKAAVTRLSDPRLETLRCFVIARRHGKESHGQLRAAGYSAGQVRLVERIAGRVRPSRGAPAWISALATILAIAAGSWEAFGYFRDLLVSLMLSGTGAVALLPLLLPTGRH